MSRYQGKRQNGRKKNSRLKKFKVKSTPKNIFLATKTRRYSRSSLRGRQRHKDTQKIQQ